MNRRIINPWTWQYQYGFVQVIENNSTSRTFFRFVLVVGIFVVVGLAARQLEAQTCAAITDAEWKAWGDLINFKPPQSVLERASATHWAWQSIESGVGSLNLDRYEIEVIRMPSSDGMRFISENLLERVRTQLPYFLYPARQPF